MDVRHWALGSGWETGNRLQVSSWDTDWEVKFIEGGEKLLPSHLSKLEKSLPCPRSMKTIFLASGKSARLHPIADKNLL